MKLMYHPASTTSRPVMMLAAEAGIALDMQVIDLFTGEHHQPPFAGINPNRMVPVLEDGDFRLSESSAILKYLADKAGSPLYPKDLQQRARVNERMDWVNTQLCRDVAYGLVYPQIFPHHKRPSDEVQAATLAWAQERAKGWLQVLDQHWLAGSPYLCGNSLTIADLFCAEFVFLDEGVGADLAAYPNVKAWMGRMKALKSWDSVHQVISGFLGSLDRSKMVCA